MVEAIDAVTAKNRTVWGRSNVSLCDVGFCSVGVDEGWELCQRDAQGRPLPNRTSFPDFPALVAHAHSKAVRIGWYLNGCKCKEKEATQKTYEGDIAALAAYQFDSIKLDDCGPHKNFSLYAELMRKSGRNFTIEVHNPSAGSCQGGDHSTCPTRTWCPFNFFRTSHDINSSPQSWVKNLQSTTAFQKWDAPLSQPSCWAYPDMLEVGRVTEPSPGTFLSWNRAHFGAWCVTSSPLILGLELTDAALQPILDVIGNSEAIAVNQQWAGHPGALVSHTVAEGGMVQLWAKPQLGGAVAALVINNSPKTASFDVNFKVLNVSGGTAMVRDIWKQRDLGKFQNHMLARVAPYDSAFLHITPSPSLQAVV